MAGNFPAISLLPKDRKVLNQKDAIKKEQNGHFSKCMPGDAGSLDRKKYLGQESFSGDAKIAHWIRFDQ